MRFAIIGRARAGKSTFAEYLADALGLTCANTSDWLVEVERFRRHRLNVLEPEAMPSPLFNKSEMRSWLIALGDAVCASHSGFLIEQALKRGTVITGIRRKEEFECLPKDVIVVFIERADSVADNFDVPKDKARFVIVNDGSLDDLRDKANEVANKCMDEMVASIQRRG
jgi:dephospho-CoA kinase